MRAWRQIEKDEGVDRGASRGRWDGGGDRWGNQGLGWIARHGEDEVYPGVNEGKPGVHRGSVEEP